MKDRSSLKKATWSQTREEQYRESCDQILFDKELELVVDGVDVYLLSKNTKNHLLTITKPKAMWYEIWFQLRDV